jgi:hypothetical protein
VVQTYLNLETSCTSGTWIHFCQFTQCHVPEETACSSRGQVLVAAQEVQFCSKLSTFKCKCSRNAKASSFLFHFSLQCCVRSSLHSISAQRRVKSSCKVSDIFVKSSCKVFDIFVKSSCKEK